MSYIEKTISRNEEIIHVVRFHWIYTFTAILYLLIFGPFILGIIVFITMMIKKWTTERILTNTRYIQKIGWIARNTEEISINRIEEVELSQSILGRILGYGSVIISGTGSGNIELKSIRKPLVFQRHLNDLRYHSK